MEQLSTTPNLVGAGIEAFGQANPKSREQIEQTAREFEGVFVSLLMKEMRNTIDEGGLFGGESSDSFGSLFDSFIGQTLGGRAASGDCLTVAGTIPKQPKPFRVAFVQHFDQGLI